jgi:hypothetical protein
MALPSFIGTYLGLLAMTLALAASPAGIVSALSSTTPLFLLAIGVVWLRERHGILSYGASRWGSSARSCSSSDLLEGESEMNLLCHSTARGATALLAALALTSPAVFAQDAKAPLHAIEVATMDGSSKRLGDYAGKVLLIVNVASACGLTPQYEGLQKLYAAHAAKGFELLGFPCNDFGAQERARTRRSRSSARRSSR